MRIRVVRVGSRRQNRSGTILSLRLDQPRPVAPKSEPVPFVFSAANLSRTYFPFRGVLFSILFHEITLIAILLFPMPHGFMEAFRAPQLAAASNRSVPELENYRVVMYLPLLGGGSQGAGLPEKKSRPRPSGSSMARPPASTKGLSYPGPQTIISDFPQPTNRFQTILQPSLVNPPILIPPLPIPNLVQIADAGPVLEPPKPPVSPPEAAKPVDPPGVQPEPKQSEVVPRPAEPPPPIPIDASKSILQATLSAMPLPRIGSPDLAIANTPDPHLSLLEGPIAPEPLQEPEQQTSEKPPETSGKLSERSAKEFSPTPSRGPDLRNLLSLTPMPALPQPVVEVPPGEARGRFVISPEPNVSASETEPGSKVGTSGSPPVIGSQPAASSGNAAASHPTVVTVTFGPGPVTTGGTGSSGKGSGANQGSGSGIGTSPGAGTGTGSGTGTGVGTGIGTGTGAGTGAGTGPGPGPFAGITIVGGIGRSGIAAPSAKVVPAPRPLQTSYGLYVVSTEHSGGGLPSFGVFSNEQVYTVFLDMRKTEMDWAPPWTLEFAVPHGTSAQPNAAEVPDQSQQGLVLPFPAIKEQPALPAELVRKYPKRMVIVYAMINTEGKLEQASVKESPDILMNEPVLSALSKWVFRPAMLNGKPVPVKVLMGIPLRLPD